MLGRAARGEIDSAERRPERKSGDSEDVTLRGHDDVGNYYAI
jgi:hypothetical protein